MSDLYESDILLWSEHQAELLRRLGQGERVNDQIDWENVAEEIESVGRNDLSTVKSHLIQALLHDLKARAWPGSREVPHWQDETLLHRSEAQLRFAPSMAQRIDVGELYRRARRLMPKTIDGLAPLPVPDTCPFTLDELLREEP